MHADIFEGILENAICQSSGKCSLKLSCSMTGMICTKCSPVQVANDAILDARSVCMREYATAPEVSVYGDPRFTFAYVPSHLHHMTFELVRLVIQSF